MEQLLHRGTNILKFSISFSSVGNNRPTKLDRSHENKCCPICLTFLFSSKTFLLPFSIYFSSIRNNRPTKLD